MYKVMCVYTYLSVCILSFNPQITYKINFIINTLRLELRLGEITCLRSPRK